MSMIGKSLAHYEITAEIGKGGMGEVYQAKDTKLGRDVAIKVPPEEFARDADRVARFQREAKLEEIQALVIAIDTEDDPTNPPDLNILPRVIQRVKNGKYILIRRSEDTADHRSYTQFKST